MDGLANVLARIHPDTRHVIYVRSSGVYGVDHGERVEEETEASKHQYKIGISYSTIQAFLDKEFPIPMVVSLSYRDRFAGENVLKSRYVELGIGAYF